MELSLADFDCDAQPPDFIPYNKFEDLLAISVLPGPLDGLCVQFAQRPGDWEAWYKSATPEEEPLPYRPVTAGEGQCCADTLHSFVCLFPCCCCCCFLSRM